MENHFKQKTVVQNGSSLTFLARFCHKSPIKYLNIHQISRIYIFDQPVYKIGGKLSNFYCNWFFDEKRACGRIIWVWVLSANYANINTCI